MTLTAMVAAILAWTTTVAAPEISDGSFDLPTLAVAGVTLATVAPVAPVPESTTTTTTATRPPIIFDPIPPGRANLGGDHHPDVPVPAFGMIEIPKIGLVHPIFEGFEESQIHWGPGHWPGSAQPGARGNAVFAGHRVTHTRAFLDIDLLVPGDQIIFRTNDGTFIYQVTDHQIVTPDATWIAKPTPDATVTLFACHPKRSAKQRYVVRGTLIGSAPPS
ncbi:MAG: class E sortase [Actinomycetota bacterium]|nr:class E sortase [Actinomycetota bacterium]